MEDRVRFYSVQSPADASRLAAGGEPWPGGLRRANLGPGFYAWDSLEIAERYRELLARHGARKDLQIIVYESSKADLDQMKTLDLTELGDDEANAWMEKHSHYGEAIPHELEHVIRNTDKGTEHYFAAAVFGRLTEVK